MLGLSTEERAWCETQLGSDADAAVEYRGVDDPSALAAGHEWPTYDVAVLSLDADSSWALALRAVDLPLPRVYLCASENAAARERARDLDASELVGRDRAGAEALLRALRHAVELARARSSSATVADSRYRTYVERSPIGVFVLDATGRYQDVNPAGRELVGYDLETMRTMCVSEIMPEVTPEFFAREYRRLVEVGYFDAEMRAITRDGRELWIDIHAVGLENNTLLAFAQDVTERRLAERALAESEARFRCYVENSITSIFVTDGAGVVVDSNPSARALLGCDAEQLHGRGVGDIVAAVDRSAAIHAMARLRSGRPYEGELRVNRADGSEVWISVRSIPLSPSRFLAYCRDITASRRAEEELLERIRLQDQLAQVAATVPGMISSVQRSPDGRMSMPYVTSQIEDIYGLSPEAVRNDFTPVLERCHPEDLSRVLAEIEASSRSLEVLRFDFRFRHDVKGERWIEVIAVPRAEADGGVLWHGFAQDITDRKRTDAALRENQAKLRAALDSMTDAVFISDVHGRFVELNDAFASFHRFGSKDQCLETLAEYPDLLDVFLTDGSLAPLEQWAVPRALRGETVVGAEYGIRRRDTGERWTGSYSFAPIRDASGEIVGSVVVARDVTQQKRIEAALRASEERARGTLDSMMEGCQIIGFDWRYRYVNEAVARQGRSTREALLGRKMTEAYPGIDKTELWATLERCMQQRVSAQLENEFVYPDGTRGWFQLSIQPSAEGLFLLSLDISERKRAEAAQRESEAKLRTVFELLPTGVALLDDADRIVYANGGMRRMLGASSELLRIGGFRPPRYVSTDRTPLEPGQLPVAMAHETGCAVHDQVVGIEGNDGTLTWYSQSAVPLEFADWKMALVSTDITARMKVEEDLVARNVVLSAQNEVALDGILVVREGGQVASYNRRFLEMWGLSKELAATGDDERLLGGVLEKLADPHGFIRRVQEIYQNTHEATRDEVTLADGRTFARDSAPMFDPRGRYFGRVWYFRDVTDARVAEEALREREQKYRTLFDGMAQGVFYQGADGAILDANPAAQSIFGLTREELLGRTSENPNWLVVGEDGLPIPPAAHPSMRALRAGLPVRDVVLGVRNPALDQLVWLSVSAEPQFRDGEAQPYQAFVTMHDITERKRLEASLHAKVTSLESLARVGREIMTQSNVDAVLQVVCRAAIDLVGGSGANVALRDATGALAPAASGAFSADLTVGEFLIGRLSVHGEWPLGFDEDDQRLLELLAAQAAAAIENARLDAALASHAANLERRIEERTAEIHRERARIQAILDALGEGVIVADPEGRMEYINSAMEAISGYGATEAIGQKPSMWASGHTPRERTAELWAIILSGRTWRGELVNRRRDGSLYDADMTIAPIFDPERPDRIMAFAAALRDVSLRKKAEADTLRALARERELGELRSRFVSMTSHEFRTPLATILSSAELLDHYGEAWSPERRKSHLERIRQAVRGMTELLETILSYGRTDAARMAFQPQRVDVGEICRALLSDFQLTAGPEHTFALVGADAPIEAELDEALLRQILNNLLSNAVKYSPRGGTVVLELTIDSEQVVLRVRDQGIGVPSEEQPRLFEEFHRASNVGSITGTGLGLPIVKRSVELHGGTIEVVSELGVGTEVIVALPQRRAA
ncbi:MAG: PAS domain S-box protein [Candidatus Eisenbacteria bacterium]